MKPFECRKRRCTIQALVYDDTTQEFLMGWLPDASFYDKARTMIIFRPPERLFHFKIRKGDYVVKNELGFDVFSPDQFWAEYEI